MMTSGLFYNSPTEIVTHYLESHHDEIFPNSADAFVRMAEDVDVAGSFDYTALARLCQNTTWREGLVVRLADSTGGGMGNVKNAFLNSLRFAIEAGGECSCERPSIYMGERR
jgi:hypothetical protein